jgi:hypothetical protein
MTLLTDKIQSRGYWLVTFNPANYIEKRVDYGDLFPILERNAVNLRGWDFPHIDPHIAISRNATWIGQESDWNQYKEAWRFYQSGQFVDAAGLWEDWLDESVLARAPEGWQTGQWLGITNTIHRFTEIFEFVTRLVTTPASDEVMHIHIVLNRLAGRALRQDPMKIPFRSPKTTSMPRYDYEKDFSKVDLLAQSRELALIAAAELFERFDWAPGIDHLRDMQEQIGKW